MAEEVVPDMICASVCLVRLTCVQPLRTYLVPFRYRNASMSF